MKILIYGGSFDPVHKGHLALLSSAIKEIKPNKTYIFTSYHCPYKNRHATSYAIRKEMAQKVFSTLKNVVFDDFELKKKRKVYTYETVKYIKKLYPNAQIFVLIGSDCLSTLHKWKHAHYSFKNATFVIGTRGGDVGAYKVDFNHHFLKGVFPQFSSTDIRVNTMVHGHAPKNILPQVSSAINKNLLYGLNCHKFLKLRLKKPRYNHVISVCKEAVLLAKTFGCDIERAALAGLLHDAGKSMSKDEMVAYANKNKIKVQNFKDICKNAPALLHAEISAHIAHTVFGVQDRGVLNAISRHTLGAKKMSTLDKILMIADMSSRGRRPQDIKKIKVALKKSFNAGLLAAEEVKLIYTVSTHKWLAPRGIKLWNESILKNS